MYKLYFDGGKRNFLISYGFVLYQDDVIKHKEGGQIEQRYLSSNAAEYFALIVALSYCLSIHIEELIVYGDSLLVINQINEECNIKSPVMKLFNQIVKNLCKRFKKIEFVWVPRTDNKEAHRAGR